MAHQTLGDPSPSVAVLEALDRVRRMGSAGEWTSVPAHRPVGKGGAPGAEVVFSAAGPDPRDPHRLGGNLSELTARFGWKTHLDIGELLGRWSQLVGPNVAEHCTPELVEPPRLVVRASSTTWATQLRVMSTVLLERLERELGRRVIEDIEIVGPVQKSWKRGRRSVKGRGPRDTYG